MNAYKPAGAYHRSVRLLYQIRLNYNIITQNYKPLVINMVESGNYHFKNKTFIISVKYGTFRYFILTGGIPKSKYSCYIAQPLMLCHNYVKFWEISSQ